MAAGEGRAPPAYQEYASEMLASRPFRAMAAAERGIWWTMRLECWTNGSVPREPSALAAVLSLDVDQVAHALPSVMPFFIVDGDELRCAELDAYRAHLEARHARFSEGGKKSAAVKKAKEKKQHTRKNGSTQGVPHDVASLQPACNQPGTTPPTSLQPLSTAKSRTAQSNPPLEKGPAPTDPWLKDYTEAEVQPVETKADAYRRASRGE